MRICLAPLCCAVLFGCVDTPADGDLQHANSPLALETHCGETVDLTLSRDATVFSLEVAAGTEVSVRLEPRRRDLRPVLAVFDDQASLLVGASPCDGGAACASFQAPSDQTYLISTSVVRGRPGPARLITACVPPPAPDPNTPRGSQAALDFLEQPCASFHHAAPSLLAGLTDEANRFFLDILPDITADDPACAISLGLPTRDTAVDFEPEALWEGRAVAEICLVLHGQPQCMAAHGRPLSAAARGLGDLINICGVLSVAHSLVYTLGTVDEAAVTQLSDGTRVWQADFLSELRRLTQHTPEDGTSADGERAGHLAKGATHCGEDEDLTGAEDHAGLRTWCLGLVERIGAQDCTLGLAGTTSGHAMHIRSARWDGAANRCTFTTTDTGRQGLGAGTDIPTEPGQQTWHVSATEAGDATHIQYGTGQRNAVFWGAQSYSAATAFCCEK
jgi:hypothetical protein